MSLFHPVTLVCPSCKAAITMASVGSVNADRRPDLRQDILDDRFQDTTCPACATSFRLQPEFNYLDAGRGQWIAAMPAQRVPGYLEVEDQAKALFDQSYGPGAPRAAQDVGDGLTVRVTFGWPAVREKILAQEHGLDDVVLEMVKLDLLRRLPSAPMGLGTELRLFRVAEDRLILVWIDTASEAAQDEVTVPRALYDAIAANEAGWAKVRAQLTDGAFVDMQKMYMGQGRAARDAARVAEPAQ